MATTVQTVVTDVLNRVRDANATMFSILTPPTVNDGEGQVATMVGYAQMYINVAEMLLPETATFTPTTNTVLYLLSSVFANPECIKVVAVKSAANELDGPCDFMGFARNSFTWLTDTGTSYIAWAQIGLDMLAIVPAFATSPPQLTLRYLYVTPIYTFSTIGSNLVVPDDTAEHVTRLAELLCRIWSRSLDGFDDRLNALKQSIKLSGSTVDGGGKAL